MYIRSRNYVALAQSFLENSHIKQTVSERAASSLMADLSVLTFSANVRYVRVPCRLVLMM